MAKINVHNLLKVELVEVLSKRCKHGHLYIEHPNCWREECNHPPRVGYIDIETSNFDAAYGIMLSYCIKVQGKDEIISNIIDPEEIRNGSFDKRLCKELIKDILKFDVLMGYYSTKFDIPYIRSRCLFHKLAFPVFKAINHKDIYYMAKRLLKLRRYSLENVTRFLGISGKNHVIGKEWLQAIMCNGEKQIKALTYILDHNMRDVEITEKLHKRLEDFDKGTVKSI